MAVAGSSMTTAPPAFLTCQAPADPSEPLPVRITAMSPGPKTPAALSNSTSMDGATEPGLAGAKPQLAVADLHQPVGGNDEDDAVLQRLPLLDHSNGQRRVAGEDLVQMAGAAWIEMLRDHDRRREVRPAGSPRARESASMPPADDPITTS